MFRRNAAILKNGYEKEVHIFDSQKIFKKWHPKAMWMKKRSIAPILVRKSMSGVKPGLRVA